MKRVHAGVLLSAALLAGVLASCGSGGNPDNEASSSEPPSASTTPPAEDFAVVMQACLAEKGWTTTVSDDGGLESSVPDGQFESYRLAHSDCSLETGYGQPAAGMSQADAENYLDAITSASRCLEDMGHEIPAAPPRGTSLEGLMSPDRDPRWDPYGNILDGPELSEAQQNCPIAG